MKDYVIYTAGGMSKFGVDNFDKSNEWRKYCKNALENYDDRKYRVIVINPNDYYNMLDSSTYDSEKEIVEFDLMKVKNSDLIICNFNDPKSLGTMAEIAIAYDNRIPVIGLNEENIELHPWQIEFCRKIFTDFDLMLDYIEDYYLM